MNETYNVAVKLSLNNQVSAGLLGLSGQFAKTQAQAAALQARLNSIKTLALTGLGLSAAGFFGLHLIGKALKPAEEYAHQLNVMNMAGMTQKEIAEAIGDAWKNTNTVITTTATHNLRTLLDLRNVLGNWEEAQKALPIVSRIQAAATSSQEGKAALKNDSDLGFNLTKAADILGKVQNTKEYETFVNEMGRAMIATQYRVTDRAILSTLLYARQAKFGFNDEFLGTIMPSLMLEYSNKQGAGGGSRGLGPMLAAGYRLGVQGYVNKKSLPEFESLGLIKKGTSLKTTTSGTTMGPVKDSDLYSANPFQWVKQDLLPAIEKKYGGHATRLQITSEINTLARGNQLAGNLWNELALKVQNFERDQKFIRKADYPEQAYQKALIADPQLARTALAAQWENVQTALTVPLVTVLIPALMHLATALNSIAQVLIKYPALATTLSYGFVALFGAMALGGIVLLLAAAFKGLALAMTLMSVPLLVIGAPILGIAAALALLAYGAYELWQTLKNISWKGLVSEFKQLWAVFAQTTAGKVLVTVFQTLWTVIKNSPLALLISSFEKLFSIIRSGVTGLVKWALGIGAEAKPAVGSNLGNLSPKSTATGKPTASNAHANSPIHVATNINLDGRQIARAVTHYQVNDALRTPNYSQGFDPSMAPTPMVLKGNIV